MLYDLVWEAVYRLERLSLKVLAVTADGASTNRLFFKLHSPSSASKEVTYKVYNPHSQEGRYIYFFSDPPHLIKTVRNAWMSKKRPLWVCCSIVPGAYNVQHILTLLVVLSTSRHTCIHVHVHYIVLYLYHMYTICAV